MRPQSMRWLFSRTALAVTAQDPRMVPRMVWGLRNFQKAFWKARTRDATEGAPCSAAEGIAGSGQMLALICRRLQSTAQAHR